MKKTIGTLIDELSVTNIKIYHLREKIRKNKLESEDSKKLEDLNKYRLGLLSGKPINKSIATLVDELSITNIKIFMLVDKVQKNEHTKQDAKKLQDLNLYRSKLMNAINEHFNEEQQIKV